MIAKPPAGPVYHAALWFIFNDATTVTGSHGERKQYLDKINLITYPYSYASVLMMYLDLCEIVVETAVRSCYFYHTTPAI